MLGAGPGSTSRIGFAPGRGTGALVPLAGFVAPAAGDTTAPTVTATSTGTAGNAGWYRSNVAVALAATDEDGGSGVASINYAVDGGPAQMVDAADRQRDGHRQRDAQRHVHRH